MRTKRAKILHLPRPLLVDHTHLIADECSGLASVEQFRAFNAAWTLQRGELLQRERGVRANPVEPG